MNLLICGDSFASDWSRHTTDRPGWPNLLSDIHHIDNIAQAGVSEYKILKQLEHSKLDQYHAVIITHTSMSRVHVEQHPVHAPDGLHANCDLIYTDLINSDSKNPVVQAGINYFKYIFDENYYTDIYQMFLARIAHIVAKHRVLHLTFFDNPVQYPFSCVNLKHLHDSCPGSVNHLSPAGNQQVYQYIEQWLNQGS
jgi:hypothetical protein